MVMTTDRRLLAADVGGTKTLIQVLAVEQGQHRVLRERRFTSGGYASFDELLRNFIQPGEGPFAAACFAVAGPAWGSRATVTNLRWEMDGEELQREFQIEKVMLINDFFAVAAGIPHLPDSDLQPVNRKERDRDGNVAILGAGTGLGEALLVGPGGTKIVIPGEGGHSTFAPRNALERQLQEYLEQRYSHVSYERLLSGAGIVNIFTFLCDRVFRLTFEQAGVKEEEGHVAAQISALAAEGSEPARKTMEIFIDVYGAEAGNLALQVLPRGGVYVAGGIAAKNLQWFTDGRFLEAYADKGRMRSLLLGFPVDVVLNPRVGLIGAGALARGMTIS